MHCNTWEDWCVISESIKALIFFLSHFISLCLALSDSWQSLCVYHMHEGLDMHLKKKREDKQSLWVLAFGEARKTKAHQPYPNTPANEPRISYSKKCHWIIFVRPEVWAAIPNWQQQTDSFYVQTRQRYDGRVCLHCQQALCSIRGGIQQCANWRNGVLGHPYRTFRYANSWCMSVGCLLGGISAIGLQWRVNQGQFNMKNKERGIFM